MTFLTDFTDNEKGQTFYFRVKKKLVSYLSIWGNGSKVAWGLSRVRRSLTSLSCIILEMGCLLSSQETMLLKLQVCLGMCACVLSLSGLVSLCISKKQLLLPSSITLMNVLKRKAYFNSSRRQTSLERGAWCLEGLLDWKIRGSGSCTQLCQ